jgi:predicted RNase H-like nuclease (RuvC/YqgF family)
MIDLKKRYEVLMDKNQRLSFRITELEEENLKLIRKTQEAIGEMTIVKGIGMNSPEMKKAKKEIEQLKKDMSLMEEGLQAEILAKDKEIGRLMKKINDKR